MDRVDKMKINEVKKIYRLMNDDLSKFIFENRLMFSLTEDAKFMRNIVFTIDRVREIQVRLEENKKKLGMFGAGVAGRYLMETFKDIEFECYIDNKCAGSTCKQLPVVSIREFMEKFPDGVVVISSRIYYREILEQLLEEGLPIKNIINVGAASDKLRHLQYFDLPQLTSVRQKKEIFVDGGCFDGDTSVGFYNWCLGNGEVYAWEPDPVNLMQCKQLFEANSIPYHLIPKGLWNEPKELRMKMNGGCSAITDEEGDTQVIVDSIDREIREPVTFIKMDIEGSEFEALLGARKMITQHKPKLAISIYHKPEDIWRLPILIHEFNPEYKFYLRHYSFSWSETVLYAI